MQGGMGIIPISWQEIYSWQQLNGISLSAWEARTIRDCSNAFVNQYHLSTKPECPSPIKVDKDQVKLGKHIKKIFRT